MDAVGTPAYDEMAAENKQLRERIRQLEKATKKKRKRGPNAYQLEWKKQYPVEVAHAKSKTATAPIEDWLLPYSRQYGDTMTTAPNPKNGEPLSKEDRSVFMKNISARAKKAVGCPPCPEDGGGGGGGGGPPTGANGDPPPSPRGVDELFD